jgi:hypothetical protein
MVLRRARHLELGAIVVLSPVVSAGQPALPRTQYATELQAGTRIRILEAVLAIDREDDAQPVVVTLGPFSGMFVVS